MAKTHEFVAIQKLMDDGILSVDTGIEIGKMAYGTGKIPFIRTSDISNWEIKADFKHGVSEAIHEELRDKVDVQAGDILLVRDGTYLIGTSAIVTESDLPMLFQSHLYRLRVLKQDQLNPWLLFASLNSPMVKRQIKAKQFTQDIIDTLGRRLFEIMLPLPKDNKLREQIATQQTQRIIETRIELRNQAKAVALAVEGLSEMDEWSVIEEDLTAMPAGVAQLDGKARIKVLLTGVNRVPDALPLSSEDTVNLIEQHLRCKSSSHLPALIVAAAFKAAKIRRAGAVGDIQITIPDGQKMVTRCEMKNKAVSSGDIDRALQKIAAQGKHVQNYIFITTESVDDEIREYARSKYDETGGVEIAILDCIGFPAPFPAPISPIDCEH